jgi:16S rRNA (uracil1498-N3)-methyltransferase
MGLPVFYAPGERIDLEAGLILFDAAEARHLTRSLRAREGDLVTVGDAVGTMYRARIGPTLSEPLRCAIEDSVYYPPERPQFVIFQGLSKNHAMDEAIVMAAECGASRLVPFACKRSPLEAVRKSGARIERWLTLARESSKRARRAWPLDVRAPIYGFLEESALNTVGECVVLWEDEDSRSLAAALPRSEPVSVGLVVGPEGGLEPFEVDVLRNLGARTASLGYLNVRAQSAGSYAVMIGRNHYGLLAPGADTDE